MSLIGIRAKMSTFMDKILNSIGGHLGPIYLSSISLIKVTILLQKWTFRARSALVLKVNTYRLCFALQIEIFMTNQM